MAKKIRKGNYSEDFKREAVELLREGRYTVPEASQHLGVSEQSLYRWQTRYGEQVDVKGAKVPKTSEESRIRELEAENRQLRMERDFLKKTAAYFIKSDG